MSKLFFEVRTDPEFVEFGLLISIYNIMGQSGFFFSPYIEYATCCAILSANTAAITAPKGVVLKSKSSQLHRTVGLVGVALLVSEEYFATISVISVILAVI